MAKTTGILEAIEVEPLRVGSITVWLKGRTPLICNRMAGKAMRELLFPKGRKGKAEREQSLKHDPLSEYRNSMSVRAGKGLTRIVFPSPAVKGAMATAALETKGTNKADRPAGLGQGLLVRRVRRAPASHVRRSFGGYEQDAGRADAGDSPGVVPARDDPIR